MFVFFRHIQYFSKHCCQHNQIKQTIQVAVIIDSSISYLIIRPEHTAECLERKKSEDDSVHDSLIQVLLLLFRKICKVETSEHNKIAKWPYIIASGKDHQKHHDYPQPEHSPVQFRILLFFHYTDKRMDHHIAKEKNIQTDHHTFVHEICKRLSQYHKQCPRHQTYSCPDSIRNLICHKFFPFIV